MNHLQARERMDGFANWLETPLGQYLIQREIAFIDKAVADVFGYYAVQLELPQYDLLRSNRMPRRIRAGSLPGAELRCDPMALPFANQSVDLLILPHTLDFHPDPHQVLREAERVLMPEGRLIITGFNPWSLWGAARRFIGRDKAPWSANFLSLPRIKDWLALLGLSPAGGRLMCFAPPFQRRGWVEKFDFMEFAGDRWWPVGGSLYCLEAVKRVRGLRLIAPAWKRPKLAGRPVPALHSNDGTAARGEIYLNRPDE